MLVLVIAILLLYGVWQASEIAMPIGGLATIRAFVLSIASLAGAAYLVAQH